MSELAAGGSQDMSEDEYVTDESTLQSPVPVIKSFKEAIIHWKMFNINFFAKSRTYGVSFGTRFIC